MNLLVKTWGRAFQEEGTVNAKALMQGLGPNYSFTHLFLVNSKAQVLFVSVFCCCCLFVCCVLFHFCVLTLSLVLVPCYLTWSVGWIKEQVKTALGPRCRPAKMCNERQLTASFLFQLDPEGSQNHRLQRREAPGQSPASSWPQILVSRPANEVQAKS